jgi:hypothetical protein
MKRNVTYFGIFLVLLCFTPAQLKSGGYGEYRLVPTRTDTDRVFERIMEQRDIKMAINTLIGEGFTTTEIEEAVQNRLARIRGWHFPGDFCSASGNVAEPGESIVVGPTYYLIIGHARIMKYIREVGSSNY